MTNDMKRKREALSVSMESASLYLMPDNTAQASVSCSHLDVAVRLVPGCTLSRLSVGLKNKSEVNAGCLNY